MTPQWKISSTPIPYIEAIQKMETFILNIAAGKASPTIWVLTHPSLYTSGTGADPRDILTPLAYPLYQTGRGGKITYHGPGQRIIYIMIPLKYCHQGLHHFIWALEEWIIEILYQVDIKGERFEGNPGIWVRNSQSQKLEKIAALGLRVRRGVTYHGFSLNISPNLTHYEAIIPCGIKGYGVTSLESLGVRISLEEVDRIIQTTFPLFWARLMEENLSYNMISGLRIHPGLLKN